MEAIKFDAKGNIGFSKGVRTTFYKMLDKLKVRKADKVFSEVRCFIEVIRTTGTMWYLSCPNEKCRKKVIDEENSMCPHCNTNYD